MAELECGQKCMKYLLFVLNFLFFLLGAAALALGVWALVDKNKMNVLTKIGAHGSNFNVIGLLESAAIVLLVGGGVVLLIGFLGCYGACKQSKCLLGLYGFLLIIVLILEIAAIVLAGVFKGKVEDEMKAFLKKNINSTYEARMDTAHEFSIGLDYAQVYKDKGREPDRLTQFNVGEVVTIALCWIHNTNNLRWMLYIYTHYKFQCCGVDNYTEFYGAQNWNRTLPGGDEMATPPSCCKLNNRDDFFDNPKNAEFKTDTCFITPQPDDSNKDRPCWDSIKKFLEQRIYIVIGIAAAILLLEILCLTFACCLISAFRKTGE